jgi:hypothetical protein
MENGRKAGETGRIITKYLKEKLIHINNKHLISWNLKNKLLG